MTATIRKKIRAPIKSSNAAIGISVRVTGPAVFISLTMDNEGAGAVAKAMPPNIKARYKGISVNQKITPNTRLTTQKVPNDSVMVVTTICFPACFSLFQISSVPIIRPTIHSSRLSIIPYHGASIKELLRKPSAWGPRTIPVMS